MRILTRLTPYLYEAEHLKDWQEDFFWKPRRPTQVLSGTERRTPIYFDGIDPRRKYRQGEIEQAIGPPLGEILLELIIDYLFSPGFAIPRRYRQDGTLDTEIVVKVWQSGIGSNKSLMCTKEHERNQMETLRLLIALSSKPMYTQTSRSIRKNLRQSQRLNFRVRCCGNLRRGNTHLDDDSSGEQGDQRHCLLPTKHGT
jgi:hypothetical protein